MIPQELIDRTKTNLERLAKAMPEFRICFIRNRILLIRHDEIFLAFKSESGELSLEIYEDPQQEFSNSIGRIAWEAFGRELPASNKLFDNIEALNILIEQELPANGEKG